MIHIQPKALDGYFAAKVPITKRCLDLFGASLAIVIITPLLLFLIVLIKLVSPGPAIFYQTRIGRGGKKFTCYKLRTMYPNVETSDHRKYLARLINGRKKNSTEKHMPMTKIEDKSKLIPFGSILRSLGLDELPQLFNVIKGDMSLVGPRPAIIYEVDEYKLWHKQRLDQLPGITGLWQVSGKNKLSFKEMIRLDLQYAQQQSFWFDVLILLKTPQVVLGQTLEIIKRKFNGWSKGGLPNV